jgi:hypothetical protein
MVEIKINALTYLCKYGHNDQYKKKLHEFHFISPEYLSLDQEEKTS